MSQLAKKLAARDRRRSNGAVGRVEELSFAPPAAPARTLVRAILALVGTALIAANVYTDGPVGYHGMLQLLAADARLAGYVPGFKPLHLIGFYALLTLATNAAQYLYFFGRELLLGGLSRREKVRTTGGLFVWGVATAALDVSISASGYYAYWHSGIDLARVDWLAFSASLGLTLILSVFALPWGVAALKKASTL